MRMFSNEKQFNYSENGKDPTIVIDLIQLIRVVEQLGEDELVIGGRHQKYNEILIYFFGEIKASNAKLVFFAQLDDERFKDINEFVPSFAEYDNIGKYGKLKKPAKHDRMTKKTQKSMGSLRPNAKLVFSAQLDDEHFENINEFLPSFADGKLKKPAQHGRMTRKKPKLMGLLRPNERLWYNILHICAKYGEVKSTYGLRARAILAYFRANSDEVMAVITRNTEFFVYDTDFEYWSLSDLEFTHLKINRFCRKTLKSVLGLNSHQMQLLEAISEDEILAKLIKKGVSPFLGMVEYVKMQICGANGYDLSKLTGRLTIQHLEVMEESISEIKDLNSYSGSWNADIYNETVADLVKNNKNFEKVLKFFQENISFAYKLINETTSGPKDLLFIDVRQSKSVQFINLVNKITMKMIGLAFKDVQPEKRPRTRTIQTKRHFNQKAEESEMEIIYPTSEY